VSRLSLSDVLASQEALVERLIVELNEERVESRELRKLLTEWISRPQRTATETVELTRAVTTAPAEVAERMLRGDAA
jgi:hypothetical protein